MAVHPDTRRMMDALQRRDLAEIFSQIGNVFEQVLPPGSEIFAIRDRLLTLGEEDLSLITEEDGGYVLRFRAVELWEGLRQWLGKH